MNHKLSATLLISFIFVILLSSCKNTSQKTEPNAMDTSVSDKTIISPEVKNINISYSSFSEIDSSGILLIPLPLNKSNNASSSTDYKRYSPINFWNIVFYNSLDEKSHLLTQEKILFTSYTREAVSAGADAVNTYFKNYIFYTGTRTDFNKDDLLDDKDPAYLYISDKEGNNFKQISPLNMKMVSWQYIKTSNKILIYVLKDSNSDKAFTEEDYEIIFEYNLNTSGPSKPIFSDSLLNEIKHMFNSNWKK